MRNKLLQLLEEDSKLTTAQLATMLNVSESDIKKEIKLCEREGIIIAYKAVVDWERTTKKDAYAIVELKVTQKSETGFDEIAQRISLFDEVKSVTLVAGATDLKIEVVGENIQDISMFVSRKLSTLPSVISTSTQFVLKKYKDSGIILWEDTDEHDGRNLL